jgi:hypothetical protein
MSEGSAGKVGWVAAQLMHPEPCPEHPKQRLRTSTHPSTLPSLRARCVVCLYVTRGQRGARGAPPFRPRVCGACGWKLSVLFMISLEA